MVVLSNFSENMGNIFLGQATSFGIATGLFLLFVIVVLIVNVWATGISLKNPRLVQRKLGAIIRPIIQALFGKLVSRQQFSRSDVMPFFRVNGYPPDTKEYDNLMRNSFSNWELKVRGLVEKPLEFSLLDLHALKKEMQITEHSCIQGWTAIGEWGGVALNYILSKCKPLPKAKYVVFYSYQYTNGEQFYETIPLELAKHPQTILAYEMNGEPLDIPHGAPLRLRVETQLGYKMVKWIKSIEFVEDYENIGMGQGGHREDHMYYESGAGI